MGANLQPGLATSVLYDLASMWGLSLYNCESIHGSEAIMGLLEKKSDNEAALETDAVAGRGKRHHGGRLLRRDSLEIDGASLLTKTMTVDAHGDIAVASLSSN